MYLWTLKRLKKVTANTQAKHVRESQAMALRDQRRDMTRAERLKRLAELGKPSTLTAILAAARSEMIRKKFPNLGRHEDDDDEEDEEATPVIMVDPPRVQEEDGDDEGTDQDYKELRQMMINLATLKEAKSAAVFCLQCLDDPTCSEANRRKDFFFESKLRVHETNFHSPGKRCARFLKSCDCERKTENGARYFSAPGAAVTTLISVIITTHSDQNDSSIGRTSSATSSSATQGKTWQRLNTT
ncbi:hypothetical protein B0H10DRAFT_1284400 [Mycena sp. CBHHK59/15]|nr:hypothetical protein B0H10DRAFT_1284400 [Mycena sp. CBHHK59/15]